MKKYLLPFLSFVLFISVHSVTYGQVITTITTIAGNGMNGDSGDGGPATAAEFEDAWFPAIDGSGNIYITDNFDHKIRKVTIAGIISTFAGNGTAGFSGDGGLAITAQFIGAAGIAVDGAGNVYFSDINNRRIRKVSAAGFISTIAGDGSAGFSGDGGPATAAQLNTPYGVAVDDTGNVYVADELNFRIRKITPAGIISTYAGVGTGGFGGDGGPALLAEFTPTGIALDRTGNLYISTNNRIRMVNTSGIIITVAGNGIAGYSGDGSAATTAKLNQPIGVAADGVGNIFISDQYNYRIRKVNDSGKISTLAGNGIAAYFGDGGPATAAELNQPIGLCYDPYGNIYTCDYGNHRIRKVLAGNRLPHFINWPADSFIVCENSVGDSVNSLLRIVDADSGQTETWTLLAPALHGAASIAFSAVSDMDTITPSGLSYTPSVGYSGRDTFKVMVNDGFSLDTVTVFVIVNSLPDTGVITGNNYVCIGAPDVLSDAATGGIWSVTNGRASVSGTGSVTGIMPGIDTVLNTFTVNGCTAVATYPVTVYPVSDSVTGPGAVCTGLSINLTGIPAGGSWDVTNADASLSGSSVMGDTAGMDTVIYTISNVCGVFHTTYPVTIIGFTIPSVIISSNPPAILAGQNDTLTAHITEGGGIPYGYQWQLNGTDIAGATDSVYISDSFLNNDSVTCFIRNGPCNFDTFTWTYITYLNDGIRNISPGMEMVLSPDPNNGQFKLKGTIVSCNSNVLIEITDILGRKVYGSDAPVENGTVSKQIVLSDNAAEGVYFLHIIAGDAYTVIQFEIKR